MKTMVKCTQAEKTMLREMLADLVFSGKVKVENDLQHKAAMILVDSGHAIVTRLKNYGRIAEIKHVENGDET